MVRRAVLTLASVPLFALACAAPTEPEPEVGTAATSLARVCYPAPSSDAAVTDAFYASAVDDPRVNKAKLSFPPLPYTWKCYYECGGKKHVACVGIADMEPRILEPNEDFSCGFPIFFSRVNPDDPTKGEHSISYRTFNQNNRITDRILHNSGTDTYSGTESTTSGPRTKGSFEYLNHSVFTTPGDTSSSTDTLTGTPDFMQSADNGDGELLVLNEGQVIFFPNGDVDIVSGRWDLFTDYDAANARMCSALSE